MTSVYRDRKNLFNHFDKQSIVADEETKREFSEHDY